ncbi:MAG TPA: isoaspartyl peptidase/L-asparaginase [Acidobacteriota bacterium]|nr:isoaspartyl peptidase/L-asparaginase [Acidobacteriota bacterium]
MTIALAVHGGAWNVPDGEAREHLTGVADVLRAAWKMLEAGAGSVDVVERAVRLLEDDATFNAGKGSHLNRLGRVELDASIMEGDGLEAGAVAAVQGVRNPVALARCVMDASPHVLLVGSGARRFAEEHDVPLCRARDLLVGRARELYLRIRAGEVALIDEEFAPGADDHMGTVGAVARDRNGLIAAATSTGGTLDKYPGRVGDSPLIGAGTYADSHHGGASSTGWGEGILRVVMAKATVGHLASGQDAAAAGRAALGELERVDGRGGLIVVDRDGHSAAVFNTPRMARGLATSEAGLLVGIDATLQSCCDV